MNIKICPACVLPTRQSHHYCPNCGASLTKTTVKFLTLEDGLPDFHENVMTRLKEWLKDSDAFMEILLILGIGCFAMIAPLGTADLLAYHLPSMPLLVYITLSVLHEPLKEVPYNSFVTFYIGFFVIFTPLSVFVCWVYE
jgi:hypothetical protein